MDETLMLKWIKGVYLKYTKKDRSLLVLDSFHGHLTESVKKSFRKGNTMMAVIPGGCTSKVQPLDVSINKPFKTELKKSWTAYMREAAKTTIENVERIKTASKEQVVSWLLSAVISIQNKPEMIMYSFLMCGISNPLDGSEDNFIRKDIPRQQAEPQNDCDCDSDSEFEGIWH